MGIRSPKPAFGIDAKILSNGSRLKESFLLKSIFTSVRMLHDNAYCSDFKRAILYPRPTLSQDKTGIIGLVVCDRCLSDCPVNIGIVEVIEKLLKSGFKDENIYVTLERYMKCGIGKCGHCNIREKFVCIDGPVFTYSQPKKFPDKDKAIA